MSRWTWRRRSCPPSAAATRTRSGEGINPKAASVILLSQVLAEEGGGGTDRDRDSSTAPVPRSALLSERFIRSVAASLEAEQVEERLAAMRILLRCIWEDGHCRSSIAERNRGLFCKPDWS